LGSPAREREDLIGAEINVAGAPDPRDLSRGLAAVEDQARAADVELEANFAPRLDPERSTDLERDRDLALLRMKK
jgi:hypothetical protein